MPQSAETVDSIVVNLLRRFIECQEDVARAQLFMAATPLSGEGNPYGMDPDREAALKAAVSTLDAGIEAIDLTFVHRVTGLFTRG